MALPLTTLETLIERRRAGEPTAALAAEVGLTPAVLRVQWSRVDLRVKPKPIGCATIRSTWRRRQEGERTADLAAELGLHEATLRYHWRQLGLARYGATMERRAMYRAAWGLRCDGASWAEVAAAVGYPAQPASLRGRVLQWRRRSGMLRSADWREHQPDG
jgi:AraC-like DNA-binding protein